jgi:hypothetical protein
MALCGKRWTVQSLVDGFVRQALDCEFPFTGKEPPIILGPEEISMAPIKIREVVKAIAESAVAEAKHQISIEIERGEAISSELRPIGPAEEVVRDRLLID